MSNELRDPIAGWHNGFDPEAAGMTVRSLDRVDHQLGEALRLELRTPGAAAGEPVHIQWYIATRMGPWAMWTACHPDEVKAREAILHEVTWFGTETVGEPLAEVDN
jgi:hypothetical protein